MGEILLAGRERRGRRDGGGGAELPDPIARNPQELDQIVRGRISGFVNTHRGTLEGAWAAASAAGAVTADLRAGNDRVVNGVLNDLKTALGIPPRTNLTLTLFENDSRLVLQVLETATGEPLCGFGAPRPNANNPACTAAMLKNEDLFIAPASMRKFDSRLIHRRANVDGIINAGGFIPDNPGRGR